jgi:hypothetical protein
MPKIAMNSDKKEKEKPKMVVAVLNDCGHPKRVHALYSCCDEDFLDMADHGQPLLPHGLVKESELD